MDDYRPIEERRRRVDMPIYVLAERAHVPETRLHFILAGRLKPDELQRIERVLATAERERGY